VVVAIQIDVSGVRTAKELHDLLFENLRFPDYYGGNWDAFDECIRDASVDLPKTVEVAGMQNLERVLPREAALFRECTSYPEVIPRFTWTP
jgi:RNAse (barnase) inhibitor barstar